MGDLPTLESWKSRGVEIETEAGFSYAETSVDAANIVDAHEAVVKIHRDSAKALRGHIARLESTLPRDKNGRVITVGAAIKTRSKTRVVLGFYYDSGWFFRLSEGYSLSLPDAKFNDNITRIEVVND